MSDLIRMAMLGKLIDALNVFEVGGESIKDIKSIVGCYDYMATILFRIGGRRFKLKLIDVDKELEAAKKGEAYG